MAKAKTVKVSGRNPDGRHISVRLPLIEVRHGVYQVKVVVGFTPHARAGIARNWYAIGVPMDNKQTWSNVWE